MRISHSPRRVNFDFGKNGSSDDRWNTIGGGPQFLFGGSFRWEGPVYYGSGPDQKVIINGEHFDAPQQKPWHYADQAYPSSVVGGDGSTLILATSRGNISARDMSSLMLDYGARDALKFDGGGSAQMYYPGKAVDIQGDGRRVANALLIYVNNSPKPPDGCPAPNLQEPTNAQSLTSTSITFRWDAGNSAGCANNKYVLRVKTTPTMDSGGEQVLNQSVTGTSASVSISDSRWYNRDLYWSVIPEVSGGQWATPRLFRISPNQPPQVSFTSANGQTISSNDQPVWGNTRDWTFVGTASDSDGSVDHVQVVCSSGCGGEQRANGTTNWNYLWSGLQGLNTIYALAYDNKGAASAASNRIRLGVDQTAPATIVDLNGARTGWPAWFNVPVRISLSASDDFSGIAELRYAFDSSGWQASSGSLIKDVPDEGSHSIQYYAIDRAGNTETGYSASFKIDRTAPTPIAGITESHGVTSGVWQNTQGLPTFTWATSTDALSGVFSYQLRLEEQGGAGEVIEAEIPASQQRTWTPNKPGGLRTGDYHLRGRVSDHAGNWSAWGDLFTFRYDKTAPENPSTVTHAAGIASEVWQNTTSVPNFTWPAAHDEGSGIKGYYAVWGTDPNATSTSLITQNSFQSATPLCGAGSACTGYLRLQSVDNVGNQAERWSTGFVLRYDDAPPTVNFSFAEGITTSQSLVTLRITASDQGSGVNAMRFSYDGKSWTNWGAFATEYPWAIPSISRQSWPVYMQVRDGVSLESPVISHTVYLDVNPLQPVSTSYRLFDRDLSAGSGSHTSANYQAHSTVGQVVDSAKLTSGGYTIVGGYEAASRAIPLTVPGYASYRLISGIFGSGSGSQQTNSASYQLVSTFGEPGLPNNATDLLSQQYILQPGFLAGAFSGPTTIIVTDPPPVVPVPPLACPFPTLSVNNAALFTNVTTVTLNICAPKATQMMLSNDGGFVGSQWEAYAATKAWTLTSYGQSVMPRYVYAAFKDADGTIHSVYFDDIIYDPTPPSGTLAVAGGVLTTTLNLRLNAALPSAPPLRMLSTQATGTVDLKLDATDDNSGIAEIQVSEQADFAGATWEPYTSTKAWQPTGADGAKTVYVRFRDSAGNISAAANTNFALDRQAPLGGIALDRRIVGPDTITTTVYLGAQDDVSGVADMRVSSDSAFTGAVWRAYATDLTWLLDTGSGNQTTLYVQYRDQVGNLSPVYSDTAKIDTTPPVVYAEATAGSTITRTVRILAYDEFSDLASMRLSNDPLMIENVTTSAYAESVSWVFDDRKVVWVQVKDSVGNWSQPYPVYADSNTFVNSSVYLPLLWR